MKTLSLFLTLTLASAPLFAAAPANDNFANATVITGDTGTASGTNVDATDEATEPPNSGGGTRSVWWKWTAPSTGFFTVDTIGSDFDTVLEVFSGSTLETLTSLASNDEDPGGNSPQSSLKFSATTGTDYYIAVTGYEAAVGAITLNWGVAPPAPVGEVGVYKSSVKETFYYQDAADSATPSAFSFTDVGTFSEYKVYDVNNDRTTSISYGTEKVGGVTNKWYSVSQERPSQLTAIPDRIPGNAIWLASNGSSFSGFTEADPVEGYLGDGYLSGNVSTTVGRAVKTVLSPALSITVPKTINVQFLNAAHGLSSTTYDPDTEESVNDDKTTRRFTRSITKVTDTLDLPLTKAANLADLDFEGLPYPKGTLENGVAQVVKALKAQGYQEGSPSY